MKTQGLTNTICNLHRHSDATTTYQQSKDCPIDGIYFSATLVANRGGILSFGRLVGDHQSLWIEINENRLLGFWQHDITPPMEQKLCLADPRTIKKFNYTLHTSFVKHDIYQNIHYIHTWYIYPLPTYIAQYFGRLEKLITCFMHASYKITEER